MITPYCTIKVWLEGRTSVPRITPLSNLHITLSFPSCPLLAIPCSAERTLYWTPVANSSSVQFSSAAQSCPTVCDPMNCSTPGLPVHHQLLESTQTHVHRVDDAMQPSHLLLSPSLPAPSPFQHQGLFQWVNSLHEVAKVNIGVSASASVLPMNTQDWSPLNSF